MLVALTRKPSPLIESGERTHVDRTAIDFERALAQHDAYRETLAECGADVRRLDDADAYPDGVFVEDTALVLPEIAIITRPGAERRRAELPGIERALREFRDIVRLVEPATLDGGDVVVVGRRILVGRSERTNSAGIVALSALTSPLGYEVTGVSMRGCLHLKTGCTALPDGRLLVNRRWVSADDLAGFDLVDVAPDEPWAGDVALVDDTIVAAAAFPHTTAHLEREGFDVRSVDLSEFARAEGGVTCLSLIFRTP